MLTHRERVLRTLYCQPTDRVPYDLMEGFVWPELLAYFTREHGLTTEEQVREFLDVDCRWIYSWDPLPDAVLDGRQPVEWLHSYSDGLYKRPLADATSVADVDAYPWPDPSEKSPPDFIAARNRWPDHALVWYAGWHPLFCGAADLFGMEEAMVKMASAPDVFEACIVHLHEYHMDFLRRGLKEAQGLADVCWLGDDYASNRGMLVNPDLWRRLIKPYLAEEVALVRQHGLPVLFHSCGAVRSILPDLIDIGVNALLVFQTTAEGMDAQSIAKDFGGHLAFYGGVDILRLLTFASPEQVEAEVRANISAFSHCGGYLVANCHQGIANIKGENIEAMFRAARS